MIDTLGERLAEEAHLRHIAAIVEFSDDAIIGNTLDGTITSWNRAAERIYGYSAAEALGRSIEMLVPAAHRDDVPGMLAQVQAGDRVEQYEAGRVRKDGTVIDVWLTISGVKDETGAIVGASTIARDINERLRGVEALRQSDNSYRLLFERHPSPMCVYDPTTLRFLAVNEAAIVSYGFSREEFLGMTVEEIRPPMSEKAIREAFADTNGNSTRGWDAPNVWCHRKKDGTLIDVLESSSSIEFEGRPATFVLAQDVTDVGLLEEQLRQSQKMEAVGSLAGGIAHDFNNLLLVIRGYSQIVMEQLSDEKLRNNMEQIDIAAQRAAEFTHQLLAFSRQQVLRPQITDLNLVVAETLKLLDRMIGEDIAVVSNLEPELASVLVDRGQVQQAILNLAVNARDAMDGGGTLTAHTANVELGPEHTSQHEDAEPGSYVLLQVTDNGKGMNRATQDRVFDPFYTTKADGTGLGLASVYGLVKQSGGHISLHSELGVGTTFKIYLPVAKVTADETVRQINTGSLRGDETILIVEDYDVVRTLVAEGLKENGYRVLTASNGADAISMFTEEEGVIDLLMTDIVMPGMNGRELAEIIVAAHPQIRILFTSGYPADAMIRRDIAEDRAAFIEKPYLVNELAEKIREVLSTVTVA